MSEPTIVCPSCESEIRLTESLAAPFKEETERAKRISAEDLAAKDRELFDAAERLKLTNEKLAVAQQAEAALLKKSRELDDAKREMELTIQRAISAGVEDARTKARKDDPHALQIDEAIHGAEQMIRRDMPVQRELVEQLRLIDLPLAHHAQALPSKQE